MYKKRGFKRILIILVMLLSILSFKFIIMKNKLFVIKNQGVFNTKKEKDVISIKKYGYSDILECLIKNKDLQIQSIDMIDNEKCNVQVIYLGDIKLLYNSLNSLNESKNFLGIDKININKEAKSTNISMYFKKNK